MRSIGIFTVLLTCFGCGQDDNRSGLTDSVPIPRGRGDDCGETNPVIQELTVAVTDPQIYETSQGPRCLPTVSITVVPFDEDGDLHYYLMDVWWDDEIDGVVAPQGPFQRIEGTIQGEECEVTSVPGITMRLGIGGSPPYETEIEFGVVIEDATGNRSNNGVPMVQPVVTPASVDESACN
jgi:hypothetical protein